MDRQAYWDGQQWSGETRPRPTPQSGLKVILRVTFGIVVVVALIIGGIFLAMMRSLGWL